MQKDAKIRWLRSTSARRSSRRRLSEICDQPLLRLQALERSVNRGDLFAPLDQPEGVEVWRGFPEVNEGDNIWVNK